MKNSINTPTKGRTKGFQHSEETKEKIRERKLGYKTLGEGIKRRKAEDDEYFFGVEENLELEEALVKAIERFCKCRYINPENPPDEKLMVESTSWQNRYYACQEHIVGIQNTIPHARRLLNEENCQYIVIAPAGYCRRDKIERDNEPVMIVKEDEIGRIYRVAMFYDLEEKEEFKKRYWKGKEWNQ